MLGKGRYKFINYNFYSFFFKNFKTGGFAKCYEITNTETKKIQAAKIIPKSTLAKNRAR